MVQQLPNAFRINADQSRTDIDRLQFAVFDITVHAVDRHAQKPGAFAARQLLLNAALNFRMAQGCMQLFACKAGIVFAQQINRRVQYDGMRLILNSH